MAYFMREFFNVDLFEADPELASLHISKIKSVVYDLGEKAAGSLTHLMEFFLVLSDAWL